MTWQESLAEHVRNLEHMAGHLDHDDVANVVEVLGACRGLLVFTGVGQNSLLASKVASTYSSLSIRAVYVDSVALLHGNLGMIRPEDLLVVLSNSGETEEACRLVRSFLDVGNTNVLAVHSSPGSTLEKLSSVSVHVPMIGEADHLGMVPTASSSCFLAFLQAVGIHLAGERNLTAETFVRTHPGGTIGDRDWTIPR